MDTTIDNLCEARDELTQTIGALERQIAAETRYTTVCRMLDKRDSFVRDLAKIEDEIVKAYNGSKKIGILKRIFKK